MSGVGVVSAESRNVRSPPQKKKKEHQESRGPGPSHPHPLYEKVQNIITLSHAFLDFFENSVIYLLHQRKNDNI